MPYYAPFYNTVKNFFEFDWNVDLYVDFQPQRDIPKTQRDMSR